MDEPLRVLFVCTANICRSAYAEGYAAATGQVEATSAGTHAREGHEMDPLMAAELSRRGLAAPPHRSRHVTPAMVDAADVVLTMERGHRAYLLDDQPAALVKVFTLGHFVRQLDEVPGSGRELVAAAARHRGRSLPEEDVVDPYRQGPEAAAECADLLSGLLDAALARLSPR